MGGVGASRPPVYSYLQESWSKVSHAAGELATVFSVTLSFLVTIVVDGQIVQRSSSCLKPRIQWAFKCARP